MGGMYTPSAAIHSASLFRLTLPQTSFCPAMGLQGAKHRQACTPAPHAAPAHLGNGLAWLYRTTPVSTCVKVTFSSFSQYADSQSTLRGCASISWRLKAAGGATHRQLSFVFDWFSSPKALTSCCLRVAWRRVSCSAAGRLRRDAPRQRRQVGVAVQPAPRLQVLQADPAALGHARPLSAGRLAERGPHDPQAVAVVAVGVARDALLPGACAVAARNDALSGRMEREPARGDARLT